MRFEPEIQGEIFNAGDYQYTIIKAEDCISKANNEQLHLVLKIEKGNKKVFIHDYILAKYTYKIKCFLESCGMKDIYTKGIIEPDLLLNLEGWARIGVKEDSVHGDKNVIEQYLKTEAVEFNDTIPF